MVCTACRGVLGCTRAPKRDSPEAAVRGLFEALNAERFDQARLYVTKRTHAKLNEWEASYRMSGKPERKQMLNDLSEVFCQDLEGQIVCTVCCTPDGAKASLKMFQENADWFVDFQSDL